MSLATRTTWLHDGWQLARLPAGACLQPQDLASAHAIWRDAPVPGTVASALHRDLAAPGHYDADDWWYRTTFTLAESSLSPGRGPGRGSDSQQGPGRRSQRHILRLDGLATLAEVWLIGERILVSRYMFIVHRVDVKARLKDVNHLAIRFASLDAALETRRPRPRWRTALISHQNLRWFRTTLLGRIPGWTPDITAVGPYLPVALETHERVEVMALDLQAHATGTTGHVRLRAHLDAFGGAVESARLWVGDTAVEAQVENGSLAADAVVPGAPLWSPHTHGTPSLVACALELIVAGESTRLPLGPIGFREIVLDDTDGAVRFRVNGVPVFCRGAVWTTMDILALRADPAALRRTLTLARDAGLNMLRVGGTMAYECDAFYSLCDELGILVWQDMMFANMDYPWGDAAFLAEAEGEVRYQLSRLQRHPCIAAYCGGSEIAQQAAMLGLPEDQWTHAFFTETLPRFVNEQHRGVPCFPSTPWGGALPFHVSTGVSHYYGVGAYRRPLSDVRTARVRFTTECLGFSNIPEPAAIALAMEGSPTPPPHHPKWKARVPRDNGAGWDFEDIRDHYLRELYRVDPVALRSEDLERYYALSRAVTGEVMRRTFAEWRAPTNGCGGALVWFFRDLWPGAGWGIVDSTGAPKAAYWHLRRAWAPQTVHLTDEGLDGLGLQVVNDAAEMLDAQVEIVMLRGGRVTAGSTAAPVRLAPHCTLSVSVDRLVGHFTDSTHAYRFGPAKHDVVAVRLVRTDPGAVLGEDCFFPLGYGLVTQPAAAIDTRVEALPDGRVAVTVSTDAFLQSLAVTSPGFVPDDNYFHVVPGRDKRVVFTREGAGDAPFRADFDALNRGGTIAVRGGSSQAPATAPANADRWDGRTERRKS